jgi:hypothetical protein
MVKVMIRRAGQKQKTPKSLPGLDLHAVCRLDG